MRPGNTEALRRNHPELLALLEQTAPLTTAHLEPSRRGPETLVWTDTGGRRRFLHSQVDPVEEARKLAAAAIAPGMTRALVVGHGAGHELRALAARGGEVWVLAATAPLLRLLCDQTDLSDIFSNPAVRWIFGRPSNMARQMAELMKDLSGREGEIAVVIHPPFVETVPEEFSSVVDVVRKIQSGRETEEELRPVAAGNFRRNLPALAAPGVSSLFGLARGRPVVVAGAGPSLDDAIEPLRGLYSFAYLIAVDTVAEGLAEMDMPADLIVSLDPRPDSMIHFHSRADRPSRPEILVFTPITYPDIVRAFEGRRMVAIPRRHFFLHPIEADLSCKGLLRSGGSVSILAASLAAAMTPAYVCLAGVDFQARPRHLYSRLSSYLRRARAELSRVSSFENVEHDFLSKELRKTPTQSTAPRLEHYASDFRLMLRETPVPFYTLGPSLEGVRRGALPCVAAPRMDRPIRVPEEGGPLPSTLMQRLGISP